MRYCKSIGNWLGTGLCILLAGCQTPVVDRPAAAAGAAEPLRVVTGLQAPEDIEILPDDRYLLLSQFGGMAGGPGKIGVFDRRTEQHRTLYPLAESASDGAATWGGVDCPGAPGSALSPHGIHLSKRSDGALQLLVVNHGGRESVEFFEVAGDAGDYRLSWRGCAVAPEDSFLNDVVALPDGRVLVTHMFNKSLASTPEGQASALAGELEGWVWQWRPDEGFSELPGSRQIFPNGIQVDAQGRYVYLNLYGRSEVAKLDLNTGKVTSRTAVPRPDNSSWAADGRLLVASHTGAVENDPACESVSSAYCPMAFQIVALDPDSMHGEVLFSHPGGPPMGAGTVAAAVDGRLYIGSFLGDRLLIVDMAGWSAALQAVQ